MLGAYIWHRQTIVELAKTTGRSKSSVQRELDATSPRLRTLTPTHTPIAADMTFWGRGYGVIVFRSPLLKQNLWWQESLFETPWVYQEGLKQLLRQGWSITGAVIDGKRGVAGVFEAQGIPVQYCQFHQVKTVTKYLTRKPQSDAGRALRALALTLAKATERDFTVGLQTWHERWKSFLEERSAAPNTKRGWVYTHRRIRAAYRSLRMNLTRLFTYQRHPELRLPNTTNTLDGMFSQIKNRLAVHRGLRRDRRFKIISEILQGREHSN